MKDLNSVQKNHLILKCSFLAKCFYSTGMHLPDTICSRTGFILVVDTAPSSLEVQGFGNFCFVYSWYCDSIARTENVVKKQVFKKSKPYPFPHHVATDLNK